jgi:GLPGLI family protein
MKKVFFSLFSCLLFVTAQAQDRQVFTIQAGNEFGVNSGAPVKQKEIDKATMEFMYDYRYLTDTANTASEVRDRMILQICHGGMSKFSSYRTMQIDSLIAASTADQILANPGRFVGGATFSVFKNYPAGKFTTVDKVSTDWFLYEEDAPVQEWTLTDDTTKEILGYRCRRAECDFRGRRYIAWYSDEIPVADGPWKLCGLPGFILEAGDSQGHYTFTLVGILSSATRPVTIPDVQFNKTTRSKFYSTKYKFDTDPIGYMSSISGIKVTITTPDGAPNNEMMRPRELKYDYIEREFRSIKN